MHFVGEEGGSELIRNSKFTVFIPEQQEGLST